MVRAGLGEGLELDRARVRLLRRELRRSEALTVAHRLLRYRDLSVARLGERLDAAGIAPRARDDALRTLAAGGVLDDERLAEATATTLARRGWANEPITLRLERLGIAASAARQAVAALEPEIDRADALVRRRGRTPHAVSYLARRGFPDEVIESVVGSVLAAAGEEGYDTDSSSDIFPA